MAKINQLRWNDARQKLPTVADYYLATYQIGAYKLDGSNDGYVYKTASAYFNPHSGWDKESTYACVVAWADMPEPWTPRKGLTSRTKKGG